jgi:predicted ester cyclase
MILKMKGASLMKINRRQAFRMAALASLSARSGWAEGHPQPESEQIERTAAASKNVATLRRYLETFNRGDIAAATQFYAEDTRNHGAPVGRKGLMRVLSDIHTTFPDWHMEEEDLVAIGDDVILRVSVTGTHKGISRLPVDGGLLIGIEPTGKTFKVQHIHWFTLKQDLIVEHRANRDDVGMMQQLGLLPEVRRYDLPQE